MDVAIVVCFYTILFTVNGEKSSSENIKSQITNLEYVVTDLLNDKELMEKEMLGMKRTQAALHSKVLTLESENMALKTKLAKIGNECDATMKTGRQLDKRLVLTGQGVNVAFTVYLDHPIHNMTSNQPIVYNKVLLNEGNAYDIRTGVFTAPMSGIYLFSYSVGSKALPNVPRPQYDIFTKLVVDGDHQVSAVAESTGTYDDEQSSSTAVLNVEEGSEVWTAHQVRGGSSLYSSAEERMSSFTGVLLYPHYA